MWIFICFMYDLFTIAIKATIIYINAFPSFILLSYTRPNSYEFEKKIDMISKIWRCKYNFDSKKLNPTKMKYYESQMVWYIKRVEVLNFVYLIIKHSNQSSNRFKTLTNFIFVCLQAMYIYVIVLRHLMIHLYIVRYTNYHHHHISHTKIFIVHSIIFQKRGALPLNLFDNGM